MNRNGYYKSLINIARLMDKNSLYFLSDSLIKLAQTQGNLQGIIPATSDDEFLRDKTNPLSRIWGDPSKYVQYKGTPGSGFFTLPDNIMELLDDVPPRFKNKSLSEIAVEINTKIPPFDPQVHQSKFRYLFEFIPEFVTIPENKSFFEDVSTLLSQVKKFLFQDKLPTSADPELNDLIKKNFDKLFLFYNNSEELKEALDFIEKKSQSPVTKPELSQPTGSKPQQKKVRITSPFGNRENPNKPGTQRFHGGIDIAAPNETVVKAALPGIVTFAGESGGEYGILIKILHAGNRETRYAHLSSVSVSENDRVSKGQVIGASGESGNATGPHLHFELRENGVPVNPPSSMQQDVI